MMWCDAILLTIVCGSRVCGNNGEGSNDFNDGRWQGNRTWTHVSYNRNSFNRGDYKWEEQNKMNNKKKDYKNVSAHSNRDSKPVYSQKEFNFKVLARFSLSHYHEIWFFSYGIDPCHQW